MLLFVRKGLLAFLFLRWFFIRVGEILIVLVIISVIDCVVVFSVLVDEGLLGPTESNLAILNLPDDGAFGSLAQLA